MSQIDLQKLTKKNQEFVHIATQQFIKDGKSDAEIKAIFEEVIPQILEEQAKVRLLVPFTAHRPTGLIALLSRSNMKKSIQKKMMIQNS